MEGNPKSIHWWVVIICLSTLFVGIYGHEPWTPDEPREAEIARAMSAGSSWLIPQLAGRPFVEKPPLYYWVSALMIRSAGRVIGPAAAVRSVSSLSALFTLFLVWSVGRLYLGSRRAAAMVLLLSTMYGFVLAAHWINIDPFLMLLVTAAVLLFFAGLDRPHPLLFLGGCLATGLAFLTKGFIAWALIALPWLAIAVWRRSNLRCRPWLSLGGFALALLPPCAWMIAFYLRGGAALWREWFIVNHFGRFTGQAGYLGHIKGPLFYFWVAPALVAPWTPLIPDWLLRRGWRKLREEPPEARRFLLGVLAWAAGGFVLLSLSSTKREVYFYPLLPGLAILLALAVEACARWTRVFFRVAGVILFLPLPVFSFLGLAWENEKVTVAPAINLPVLACALIGVLVLIMLRNNYFPRTAALSGLFYLAFFFSAIPILDQVWSYKPVTLTISRAIPRGMEKRVCGWYAGEVERAIFLYYCGITLPDVRDTRRLVEILAGRDNQYDLLVVSRMEEEFPADDPGLPPWEVLARARKGSGRYFYLIGGKKFLEMKRLLGDAEESSR